MVFTKAMVLAEVRKKGKCFSQLEANYVGATVRPVTDFILSSLLPSYSEGVRIRRCKSCVFWLGNRQCSVVCGDIDPEGSSRFFLPRTGSILVPREAAANREVTEIAYPLGTFLPFVGRKEET